MMKFSHIPSLFLRKKGGRLALLGAVCVGSGVMLTACSSGPTAYYVLAPQEGAVAPSLVGMTVPQVVEVRTPSVTARLDKDGIVQVTRNAQDHIIPGAAWSEPLNEMIGHTLVANLRQRLPGHIVFSQNESVAVGPGAFVELSLSRFEEDDADHAIIKGVLSAHRVGASPAEARAVPVQWVSSQPVMGGQAALVARLAEGLGALSDQTIQLLSSLPPSTR